VILCHLDKLGPGLKKLFGGKKAERVDEREMEAVHLAAINAD
jgi:hypothetical protein